MITNEVTGTDYMSATGENEFGMTNDYVFRIVFQENKYALKGLLCAVLKLKEEQIVDLDIKNVVKPGESISGKEYRLDILVELNDNTRIDLEMQLADLGNWEYRSLSYLCREYDVLDHGEDYDKVQPVYQIGFLDYTLFEDHPEFVAKYQMRNEKDGHLYTDRFNLIVVSLNQTEMATEEDRTYEIDKWVKLFKSETWEDIKMIANDNKYMTSAAQSVYLSNEDENVRKIARDREEYLRRENAREKKLKILEEENQKLGDENQKLEDEIKKLRQVIKDNGMEV